MGNGRTDQLNAFVTQLTNPVAAPDLTITVNAAPILPLPYYLVIDPLNPEREYVLVTGAAGNVLTVTRSLAGTGSTTHIADEPVIVAPMAQHFEDIWDVLDLAGAQVDHTELSGVVTDQHHTRYSDAEAISAVGPHNLLHSALTDVGSLPSAHHTRYADSEAIAAVDNGTYLKLTGGTLTGLLTLSADPTNALHAATKQYVDAAVPVGIASWDLDGGTADSRPGAGLWRRNNAVPASVTFLYWDFISQAGIDLSSEVLNIKAQNVMYLRSYDGQRVEVYLVTADAVNGTNYARIAVTFDQQLSALNVGDETFISTFGGGAADNFYLRLDGANSPSGNINWGGNKITNIGQGTGATDVANLDNIDAKIVTHTAIVSAHHVKYTDGEARTAMNSLANTNPLNHNRYTDSEADARADLLDHDHATPITAHADISAAHHSRYTDQEAINAVGIPGVGTFLELAGGQMVGNITLVGDPTIDDHPATKRYADLMLPLTGGLMTGEINMGSDKIVNLLDPTADQDAATKTYADGINALHHFVQSLAPPAPVLGDVWVNPDDPPEGVYVLLTGDTMSGNLRVNGSDGNPANGVLAAAIVAAGSFGGGLGVLDGAAGWVLGAEAGGATLTFSQGPSGSSLGRHMELSSTAGLNMLNKDVYNVLNINTSGFANIGDGTGRKVIQLTGAGAGISASHVNIINQAAPKFRGNGIFFIDDDVVGAQAGDNWWYWGTPYSTGGRLEMRRRSGAGVSADAIGGDMRNQDFIAIALDPNTGQMTLGNQLIVNGIGIKYPGVTITGGTDNTIGFKWVSGNSVFAGIDNVVSLQVSNVSDRRLKFNESLVESALDILMVMPDLYRYNTKGFDGVEYPDNTVYGMFADEMEGPLPELVSGDGYDNEEGNPTYQSIDYLTIVPILVQAVKELRAEVEALNG